MHRVMGGNVMAAWYSTCGVVDVSDDFYPQPAAEGGVPRDVTMIVHRDKQVVGSYVCGNGAATGTKCGAIESKHFDPYGGSQHEWSPTFVRVDYKEPLTDPSNDKGAPWARGTHAYGIEVTTAYDIGEDNYDPIYMPLNYASELSSHGTYAAPIIVNRQDPSGPGCTLSVP
jgi:hypothetical protein